MTDEPDVSAIKDILRKGGWQDEESQPIELKEGEVKNIADLLGETEMGETFALPEGVRQELTPPEKERVRNVVGGFFGEDEEQPVNRDPWSRQIPQLGTVTVSEEELAEYTRALMHDQRFELTLPVYLGDEPMLIRMRSLYVSEREVMAQAVNQIAEEYPIKSLPNAAIVADYFLKLAILIQVVSIDGQSNYPYDARPEAGELAENSPKVAELKKLGRTRFGEMHQAKLKLLIRALHIFETKQQILEDAYYNRDFPRPAGAS